MMVNAIATVTVLSGMIGLAAWTIGIADHLYRLGWQRGQRRRRNDRIDNTIIAVGAVFMAGFIGGLWYLVLAH